MSINYTYLAFSILAFLTIINFGMKLFMYFGSGNIEKEDIESAPKEIRMDIIFMNLSLLFGILLFIGAFL